MRVMNLGYINVHLVLKILVFNNYEKTEEMSHNYIWHLNLS